MTDNHDATAPAYMHVLSPHLVCAGAADAIAFYKAAFDATEMIRLAGPEGKLMHASICVNGSSVMLVDENPAFGMLSPKSLKGSPVTIHLIVKDVDAVVRQATDAGATVKMPVQDMFWGDRYGLIEDPFGHLWSVATPQRAPMTAAELAAAAQAAMCGAGGSGTA
jgi:PhnB protein